ncbi:MAG: histidine triad nucleotide-binding protein [Clostridiales bacterium]|nr:histidine triad nucleotide-binding protein [Clostridiales bacterium]
MTDCLFCQIIKGKIPSTKVYEDDFTYAFEDISPQAPTHVLVISKEHVQDLSDAVATLHDTALASCLKACSKVVDIKNLKANGYRIVSNAGVHGCQSVSHFHIHVLGGKPLTETLG